MTRQKGIMELATLVFVTALFLVTASVDKVCAKTFRLTIGAGHPAKAVVWAQRAQDFFEPEVKRRVEERTKHEIKWVEAYGGSVAKVGEELEAVESGILDMATTVYIFEPIKLFLHNWSIAVPFQSPDPMLIQKISAKMFEDFPYLREVLEREYNQKFLGGVGALSSYHIITTFPASKIEDFKGRKIGAAGPNLPWVEAVGAIPVQSNFVEAYTSLQTGVYEGFIIFTPSVVGFKIYEVAKHYIFSDFGSPTSPFLTVNLDRWNSLPKEIQDIMIEVAKEWGVKVAERAAEREKKGQEILKKHGVQFHYLTYEQKKRWANLIPDMPNEKAKAADKKGMPGSALMKAYLNEMEKAGFRFPRRWVIK